MNYRSEKELGYKQTLVRLCYKYWRGVNHGGSLIGDSERKTKAKILNDYYNQLTDMGKNVLIFVIEYPTHDAEYLTYLGVDSDLVERYSKQYLKDNKNEKRPSQKTIR